MKYIALEHHPNDSRLRIVDEDVCQTLNQRMGTGGGNVPLVMGIEDACDTEKIFKRDYSRNRH